jgi:cell division protein FtsI (penicillin-binding protein 3)
MSYAGRFYTIIGLLAFAGLCLVLRMADLSIFNRNFLLKQGDARMHRIVSVPAHRGMITDRNGKPLAVSAQVHAVWVNAKLIPLDHPELDHFAKLLGWSPVKLRHRLNQSKNKTFVYLNRSLPPGQAKVIENLEIPGVYTEKTYKRYYPEGEVMAHLLGITNVDDIGQEGIELQFDEWLRGVPGKKEVLKDRLGQVVAELNMQRQPREGHDLALSIDSRIQFIAYRAIAEAVEEFQAKAGTVIVIDVNNSEVLAMANAPSYNPNALNGPRDGRYRNRAVTDVLEPGSTLKAFNVVSFLQSGKFKPDTLIDTNPGRIVIDGNTISDVNNYGVITVAQSIQHSSNIAMSKMAAVVGSKKITQTLFNLGFSEKTASGFPGEVSGTLSTRHRWRPIELANLAMGYAMTVTPLQLAQGYTVLAAGGVKRPISLVKKDQVTSGERVLPEKVVHEVQEMLAMVTDSGGTGTKATVAGYRVGGKTGTAYIAGKHGYDKQRYFSSFAGLAPMDKPRLVCVVVVTEPKKQHFGALVAAPVFSKVMAGALRLLAVPPDNLPPEEEKGQFPEKKGMATNTIQTQM